MARTWCPVPLRLLRDGRFLRLPPIDSAVLLRLYMACDPYGRGPCDEWALRSATGLLEVPNITAIMDGLASAGLLVIYADRVNGGAAWQLERYEDDLTAEMRRKRAGASLWPNPPAIEWQGGGPNGAGEAPERHREAAGGAPAVDSVGVGAGGQEGAGKGPVVGGGGDAVGARKGAPDGSGVGWDAYGLSDAWEGPNRGQFDGGDEAVGFAMATSPRMAWDVRRDAEERAALAERAALTRAPAGRPNGAALAPPDETRRDETEKRPPGAARAPAHTHARTWPTPEHEAVAATWLDTLYKFARLGMPAGSPTLDTLRALAEQEPGFIAACRHTIALAETWEGWRVRWPISWLRTECRRAARAPTPRPPAPPPDPRAVSQRVDDRVDIVIELDPTGLDPARIYRLSWEEKRARLVGIDRSGRRFSIADRPDLLALCDWSDQLASREPPPAWATDVIFGSHA